MKLIIAGPEPSITRPLQFPDRKLSKKNNDAPIKYILPKMNPQATNNVTLPLYSARTISLTTMYPRGNVIP